MQLRVMQWWYPISETGKCRLCSRSMSKLKMTVLVSTRETWMVTVPAHMVQTQSPGLFQWREFASWAVRKKNTNQCVGVKLSTGVIDRKRFKFLPEEKAGCFIPFPDISWISSCKISLPDSPQWEKEVVILLKPFRFRSGMFQIFLILLSFSL